MDRVTLRVPEQQVSELDGHVDRGRFPNRSEAIRTAIRDMLDELDGEKPGHEMWSKAETADDD